MVLKTYNVWLQNNIWFGKILVRERITWIQVLESSFFNARQQQFLFCWPKIVRPELREIKAYFPIQNFLHYLLLGT